MPWWLSILIQIVETVLSNIKTTPVAMSGEEDLKALQKIEDALKVLKA